MRSLVPDRLRRRWKNRKIARKKYSCSTYMLYLGLEGLQEELPHHCIYLTEDYQKNLEDIEAGLRLPDDPSFYVQNACVTDPTLAPTGRSTLYVLVPVPHRSDKINWRREQAGFRQIVLRQLAKVGIEDVERRIRVEHAISPRDWERQGIYRGATFNLSHNLTQMLHMRPRNRFEDLDAVYLVGGGTHPGSGLPTIYSSARITCHSLLQDLGVDAPRPAPTALPRVEETFTGVPEAVLG
jgi:phytoene desaturase